MGVDRRVAAGKLRHGKLSALLRSQAFVYAYLEQRRSVGAGLVNGSYSHATGLQEVHGKWIRPGCVGFAGGHECVLPRITERNAVPAVSVSNGGWPLHRGIFLDPAGLGLYRRAFANGQARKRRDLRSLYAFLGRTLAAGCVRVSVLRFRCASVDAYPREFGKPHKIVDVLGRS